jgi:hypothetical protein
MTFPYTPECDVRCTLQLAPVPGAERWPRRLICRLHGYPGERAQHLTASEPESDPPNNYIEEIAGPADLVDNGNSITLMY